MKARMMNADGSALELEGEPEEILTVIVTSQRLAAPEAAAAPEPERETVAAEAKDGPAMLVTSHGIYVSLADAIAKGAQYGSA